MIINTATYDKKKKREDFENFQQLQTKQEKEEKIRFTFMENSDLKYKYNNLKHEVDLAMKANEDDLKDKRNRLKAKLLEDESGLMYEYVEKAQKYADKLQEEKKKRAEAILEANEKDRLEFVNEMYRKQKLINCDPLRAKMQRDRRKMLVKVHELQIKEKQCLKKTEKDLEMICCKLMRNVDNYDVENVEKRQNIKNRLKLEDELKKQIVARELAHGEKQLQNVQELELRLKLQEQIEREEGMKKEIVQKNKEKLRDDLLGQIEFNRDLQKRRKQWEDRMDNIFIEELKRETEQCIQLELQRERELVKEMKEFEQASMEIAVFKNKLDQLEDERLIKITNENLNNFKQIQAQKKIENRKFAKEIKSFWDEQVKGKEHRNVIKKEIEISESKLHEAYNADLNAAKDKERHTEALRLQDALLAQMEYNKLLKKQEKEDSLKFEKQLIDARELELIECEKMDYNLQRKRHPFTLALFHE